MNLLGRSALFLLPLFTGIFAAVGAETSLSQEREGARTVLLVPLSEKSPTSELPFLCAVPAAFADGERFTPILTVDPAAPWRPETLDFLRRYRAERCLWLGDEFSVELPAGGAECEALGIDDPFLIAAAIAERFWTKAKRAVVFEVGDRGAGLAASSLAARISAPLFPVRDGDLEDTNRRTAEALGIRELLWVVEESDVATRSFSGFSTRRIDGAEGVVRWLKREKLPVTYLAATNPRDAAFGPARNLSLAAVLFAAGREGAVATLPYDTRWKVPFPANEASEGEASLGTIVFGDTSTSFAIDPGGGPRRARIDLDGNDTFADEGEGPFVTGDVIELAGERWTVDLDAVEAERGSKLWLATPDRETVRADLARYLDAAKGEVAHLCLVGWPQVLPAVIVSDAQGIDTDLVSDLPLADTDDDPFVELAAARVIAEDVHAGVLLANRSLLYDELRDETSSRSFATAEWETFSARAFESFGFEHVGHHSGDAVIEADSPLTRASVIVHASHAMWTVMGKTYAWDTAVLLAPCFVFSSGCSTASLDQDPEFRSVAARMLRHGAVVFVGNSRRGIAQQDYFNTALRHALLGGATLGEANRHALNCVMVAVLDEGEEERGPHRYQLYNHAVYGDPALVLHRPTAPTVEPARAVQQGRKVTVHPPATWWTYEEPPLEEWGSTLETMHYLRGAGIATDSWWYPAEKRDQEAAWFTVEVRTKRKSARVESVGEVPAPLGWSGNAFVDAHSDGTQSLRWRCRLIDFDMRTGEVGAQRKSLSFRLK